ncbi:MAG TPA: ASCH/PUA domain-containing protein [Labilithrix sp.]|jgi:hypothetical protein|nr:ASCH/PUA domain-containing protein [Labilithrix sp.]
MAEHELKVWPSFFRELAEGRKRFEARRADRDYAVGDVLRLREWDPQHAPYSLAYTGRELRMRVTYVLFGGRFGIDAGHCVMSIEPTQLPGEGEPR